MDNQRRDRGRYGGGRFEDTNAPRKPEPKRDPGAYIGRMPERSIATPGGFGQRGGPAASPPSPAPPSPAPASPPPPSPVRGDTNADAGAPPEGQREGAKATDETVREAGQNR